MRLHGIVEKHHDKITLLARLGFLARAVTYATIGLMAIQVAFRNGGKLIDTNGAFLTLASQPYGKFVLALVGLGFSSYAIWRLVMAFAPQDVLLKCSRKPTNPLSGGKPESGAKSWTKAFRRISQPGVKVLARRIGHGINGLIHAGLALAAFRLIFWNLVGSGDAVRIWSARLMALPQGLWAVGVAGLIVAAIGCYELYRAFNGGFRDHIDLDCLNEQARSGFCHLAKWGITARGLIFCLIGWFLVRAAMLQSPAQARGLGGTLAAISAQPYGKLMLALIATGLLLFAAFSAYEARFYRLYVTRSDAC